MRALGQNLELVRETGFEPAWCVAPNAAKAFASPYSATPARLETGRDRQTPTTASSYFDSMLAGGGRAKTLGQRHAIGLAAIGIVLRWWSGAGVFARPGSHSFDQCLCERI